MPNRILKQSICTSPNLNTLSVGAENFFYRLIVQCDDFGRFHADLSILRAYCFPLRIDSTTNEQVEEWVGELVGAEIMYLYGNGKHLQMTNWLKHQTKRADTSRFPNPTRDEIICAQMQAEAFRCKHMSPYSYSLTYSRTYSEGANGNEKQAATPPPPTEPEPKLPDEPKTNKQESKPKKKRAEKPAIEVPKSRRGTRNAWVNTFRKAPHQIRAFVSVRQRYPPKEIWGAIVSAVPDETAALRKWCKALIAYSKAGYNRNAIDGPLEWFKNGIPKKFQAVAGGNHAARQSVQAKSGNPNAGRYEHKPFDPTRQRVTPVS